MKLSGRIALITGFSSGIGRATAFYIAEEGADVAVNYGSYEKDAKEVVKKIEDMGSKGLAVRADVPSDYLRSWQVQIKLKHQKEE